MMAPRTFPIIAKTISGLENVLVSDLESLGATDIMKLNRAVSFTGDQELLYRSNYCCRTALRILKPIFHFEILEQKDLYDRLYEYGWEEIIDPENTISIDAVISYTVFTNSQFVAQKSKDAIVDRLRDKLGKRPSVDIENPDLRINVHLFKDLCTVSLDSSGQSLHRRGYRKSTGPAPINEVLAAGLVLLSGWDTVTPLLDPMCGSGTLLIEAALLAKQIPAGYFRDEFGFMKWKNFDAGLWDKVKSESNALISTNTIHLFGADRAGRAIASAQENIRFTGLLHDIILKEISFEESIPPFEKGVIICNPPYDERIKLDDAMAFYKMIGDTLKRKYSGYDAWFISSDIESIKFIGLRPSRKITVFNGPLECRFVKFEVYSGKKGS
ncbi:MAG: THUMP domain-containing protein [Bacteroidales bacterium]|jgi:putative N6-adenine-specific DNA methylase|nr:THUMP domain-containing protein [Bacteroidales bacterium]